MDDFKREHRYWVIKRKHLTPEQDEACRQFCGRLRYEGVPEVETVSVESDWAIYEAVWEMVQRLAEGRPQQLEELRQDAEEWEQLAYRYQAERDALAAHVEAAEDIIGRRNYCELDDWVDTPLTTSLARLKAQWQAEAVEEARRRMQGTCYGDLRLDEYIEELRRQAEQQRSER